MLKMFVKHLFSGIQSFVVGILLMYVIKQGLDLKGLDFLKGDFGEISYLGVVFYKCLWLLIVLFCSVK